VSGREHVPATPAPAPSPAPQPAAPRRQAAEQLLRLQRTAGNRATVRALSLQRTPKEVSLARKDGPYEWTAKFTTDIVGSEVVATIKAKIVPDADVTPEELAAVKTQTQTEFTRLWDSKFVLTEGTTDYTLRVKLEYVDSGEHLSIKLHKGSARNNLESWSTDLGKSLTRAHELGHQLGLFDEYVDPRVDARKDATSPGVHTDHSIMGNYYDEGKAIAEAKLRHGQSIGAAIGTSQGKTFTVKMKGATPAPAPAK
jgi:hypothetical protein